jgi:co-chaperonin GroES (HSP10)
MKNEPFTVVDKRKRVIEADQAAVIETEEPLTIEEAPVQARGIGELDRVYDDPLPIFDRVLIRRNAEATTFAGTQFFIPESARKSANRGVVVATAHFYIVEGKAFPMVELVKPGDVVTFSGFNTEDIEMEEGTFTLCSVFDLKLVEKCHVALGVSGAVGL